MSSSVSGMVPLTVLVPEVAAIWMVYGPFGRPGGGVNVSVCGPAGLCASTKVARVWFAGETSAATTVARVVSVYETVVDSPGATAAGAAAAFWSASATVCPSVPVADRAPGELIVHE